MHLYIGTNAHVLAVDVKTGAEVWRTKLPHGVFTVCVLEADGRVFAGSGGYLHALDARTGKPLWKKKLKGLGFQPVTLAAGGKSMQLVSEPRSVVVPIPI